MAIAKDGDIFSAVEDGNISKLQSLISAGADVKARTKWDETPLHIAADRGNVEIAKVLLEHGADINVRNNKRGDTPLHRAVAKGNVEMVKFLLKQGADVHARNRYDDPPIQIAIEDEERNAEMIQFLLIYEYDL